MNLSERVAGLVTEHSKLVVVLSLVVVLAVGSGAASIPSSSSEPITIEPTAEQKAQYIQENYPVGTDNVTIVAVYVRDSDGNVLSKESLRRSLRYQQRVRSGSDEASRLIAERGRTIGVATALTTRLTGDPNATTAERIAALNATSTTQYRSALTSLLSADSEALRLMPDSYEPGTTTATGRRMVFVVPDSALSEDPTAGVDDDELGRAIYDALPDDTTSEYFMLSDPAGDDLLQRANSDLLELVGPIALTLVLFALVFAYRDFVDIVVGMIGVVAALLLTLGLMGWLGIPFGSAGTIAPILIIGLSIDYSFHLFMRYRENRDETTDRRTAMRIGLSGVTVALTLVTVTTVLGFLSNSTSPLPDVRHLTTAMALGIVAALFVFVTLVPALKIEIDNLRVRLLSDPYRAPFGDGGRIGSFLGLGVSAARISAVAVILLSVVAASGGVVAWTQLDRSLQTGIDQPADWSQDLPEPFGVEEYEWLQHREYVEQSYLSSDPEATPSQILVEGNVTRSSVLHRLDTARETAANSSVAYERSGGAASTTGPLTEMRRVAQRDEQFRKVFDNADTDGDGVPEQNVTGVYDAFYRAAPTTAATVIERDGGEYRSLRVVIQTERTTDATKVYDTLTASVEPIEKLSGVTVSVTGSQAITAGLLRIAVENVFRTVLLSLGAVLLLLLGVYRFVEGSASLGLVAFVPVALVVALISVGMAVLSVPITFFTALMIGLVIGLGVDYSIHITDRFASEIRDTADPFTALDRTVTGTGGALLGSTVTTVSAFGTLALSPFSQTANIGSVVGLALLGAFLVSVFVLPSLLVVWHRRIGHRITA